MTKLMIVNYLEKTVVLLVKVINQNVEITVFKDTLDNQAIPGSRRVAHSQEMAYPVPEKFDWILNNRTGADFEITKNKRENKFLLILFPNQAN